MLHVHIVSTSFLFLEVRPGAPFVAFLLLVAMPFAPSSVLYILFQCNFGLQLLAPSASHLQMERARIPATAMDLTV